MGVVYKVEDTELGRFVALKFLPADVTQDPHSLERFRREARVASVLNIPTSSPSTRLASRKASRSSLMEYLDGATLKHLIGNRRMDLETLLSFGIDMIEPRGIALCLLLC